MPEPAEQVEEVPGYAVLERVGRGGFSVVYRAYQEHLQRTVALKVLLLDVADDRQLRRFRRECQLTARLTGHPNIVTVLDTGSTRSGRPYIATEYFERGSLRDRLAAEGPLPVAEVLKIGVKIAGALAAAHEAGILHRDVKPQNILVNRYGEPALADFGVATLMDSIEVSARSEALTPYHAAPEVLEGEQPTVASDVYGLGSTLYQLLAGRPAHQRDAEGGIAPLLLRILSQEPPDIARPDLPPAVMAALRQAMARNPADRFADAAAFGQRLTELQAQLALPVTELLRQGATAQQGPGEPLLPRGAPASPQPWSEPAGLDQTISRPGRAAPLPAPVKKPRGRWPTLALAALLAVVLGVGGAIGLRYATGPHARPTPTPSPSGTAAQVPPAVLDAARPTNVQVVSDNQTSVLLHWSIPAGNQYPLFVQRAAANQQPATASLNSSSTTTTTVTGLDPKAGYCFQVGALVAEGNPSAVAWSKPACIRGAFPQPSPTP